MSGEGAVSVTGGQTATATITNTRVQRPGIALSKVANPTRALPGEVVQYTLSTRTPGTSRHQRHAD